MGDRDILSDRGTGTAGGASRRRRDPEDARRRILRAAEREFAVRGPAGARVDRIARAAGLNKRMLYHYFGGKQALYRTVLEHAWPRPGERWRPEAARLLLWSLLDASTAPDALAALRRRGAEVPIAAGATIEGAADPVVSVVESWLAATGMAAPRWGQERRETAGPETARPETARAPSAGSVPRSKPRIRLKPRPG